MDLKMKNSNRPGKAVIRPGKDHHFRLIIMITIFVFVFSFCSSSFCIEPEKSEKSKYALLSKVYTNSSIHFPFLNGDYVSSRTEAAAEDASKEAIDSKAGNPDTFVTGNYVGFFGYSNLWIPEASFTRTGNQITGWLVLVHDDFVVKQYFSGSVVLDMGSPVGSGYRHVKVQMLGTKVEYIKTSAVFDERMKNKIDTFIRYINYLSFSQDDKLGGVVLLGKVNYSGLDHEFPSQYYNLFGNLILAKI
jgi:hypothetical protein